MPKRSQVDGYPPEIKAWLDIELVKRGFSDYVQLAADLMAKGVPASKSGLHRYGSVFEERIANLKRSTEMAKALVDASPDTDGAMQESLVRMASEKIFQLFQAVGDDGSPTELDPDSLAKMTKAIADLTRASVTQKKWAQEVRGKMGQKFAALEGEAAKPKSGVDLATLNRVKLEMYGIVG